MCAERNLTTERLSGRIKILDTAEIYERAKKQREVFYGKPVKQEIKLPFGWPDTLVYMGRAVSELYFSDKTLNGGEWEIYKHVAEAGQDLYMNPAITTLIGDNGRKWRSFGQRFALKGAMPKTISVLAENKGVQMVTPGGQYYEVRLLHSTTAAATHPETNEVFLVVYSKEGVHFVITGDDLSIGKDGIAG